MRETRVQSLGQEDPLEKEMATHSSILAWRIPWMEEPGRLQSTGSQRVGHDWVTSFHFTSLHLGRGVSPHHCPSWPWMWSSSSRPSCSGATTALWMWGCSSQLPPLTLDGGGVAPLGCCPYILNYFYFLKFIYICNLLIITFRKKSNRKQVRGSKGYIGKL